MNDDEYFKKVRDYILNLDKDSWIPLNSICHAESMTKFIKCLKDVFDEFPDTFEFSEGHSEIRKRKAYKCWAKWDENQKKLINI